MRIAGGTAKRITKRIINFILVIWGVVTLSFCLQVFTGTDPAEMIVRKVNVFATEEQIQAVREELGLDAPFLERYTDYIKGVLTGDLGTAITNRQPVIENIKDALPVTCMLVVMAMAWVIIFTVLIAAISVIRKGGIFDNVMRIILHHWDLCAELLAGADPADRLCGSNPHFQCDLGRQFQIFDFAIGSNGVPYYLYCGQGAAGGSAE